MNVLMELGKEIGAWGDALLGDPRERFSPSDVKSAILNFCITAGGREMLPPSLSALLDEADKKEKALIANRSEVVADFYKPGLISAVEKAIESVSRAAFMQALPQV